MSKKKRRSRGQARTKQQKGPSLVIPIIVGVVVLAMAVGVIIFSESRRSASAGPAEGSATQANTAQPLNTRSIPHPDVPRISLEETQDQLEQGQAILVDVRSKASYDRAHAAGAVSIPEEEIDTRLDELPRDKDIILYCT